jgi:hypothetical protein
MEKIVYVCLSVCLSVAFFFEQATCFPWERGLCQKQMNHQRIIGYWTALELCAICVLSHRWNDWCNEEDCVCRRRFCCSIVRREAACFLWERIIPEADEPSTYMLLVGSWGFAQSLFFSNGCSYWCKVAKVVSTALSLEKWLVFFERVSLQKQMSDQYTCYFFSICSTSLTSFWILWFSTMLTVVWILVFHKRSYETGC